MCVVSEIVFYCTIKDLKIDISRLEYWTKTDGTRQNIYTCQILLLSQIIFARRKEAA